MKDYAKGRAAKHHWDDPNIQRAKTADQRFWEKVEKSDGCWMWMASTDGAGYPKIAYEGKMRKASRVCLSLTKGFDIDDKAKVLHSCDNPMCVRPDHLEIGTLSKNNFDAYKRGRRKPNNRTACVHGHAYTVANTRFQTARKPDGREYRVRVCAECSRLRSLKHYLGRPRRKA